MKRKGITDEPGQVFEFTNGPGFLSQPYDATRSAEARKAARRTTEEVRRSAQAASQAATTAAIIAATSATLGNV